tara:strand:+ start:1151 stop:1279 length:129 start_codon:yes stop_codon:yes gene_type:complete
MGSRSLWGLMKNMGFLLKINRYLMKIDTSRTFLLRGWIIGRA